MLSDTVPNCSSCSCLSPVLHSAALFSSAVYDVPTTAAPLATPASHNHALVAQSYNSVVQSHADDHFDDGADSHTHDSDDDKLFEEAPAARAPTPTAPVATLLSSSRGASTVVHGNRIASDTMPLVTPATRPVAGGGGSYAALANKHRTMASSTANKGRTQLSEC
jgi:hypothetical protein